jgi:phosphatidylserine/phosphatidylglycerophosphate/cardiolipin synthase-like enzyme
MTRLCIARRQIFLVLIITGMLLSACVPPTREESAPDTVITGTAPATESAWLEPFFTRPENRPSNGYEGGPDEALAAAIDRARLTVDVAAYSLNLWSIRDALIHARQRGVVVRMVMESDNMDNEEVQQMLDVGIPIHDDQREGLMHNKFIVLDRSEVWTGSMNFTLSGAYYDNNNLLRIRSTRVAETYTTKFDEMFAEDRFGPGARQPAADPVATVDGIEMETYFSPEDTIAAHILAIIQNANESIYFLAYSFTADDLGAAIRQRAAEGLPVAGVMEDGQINSNQGSEYDSFLQADMDVRRDGNDGQMHDKVIIIDRSIVITGSYNFTASAAEQNDENVVIIHDPAIASQYMEEFQHIFDQAHP